MEKSQCNKKRRRTRKNGRMVVGKTSWSFSWHQEKLHKFISCKVKLTWRRSRAKKKMKKKKKWKNGCKKKPMELLLVSRKVPQVFFFVMKVCKLEILQKNPHLALFHVEKGLVLRKDQREVNERLKKKNPIKFLSTPRKAWWVCFLQS